MLFRDEQDMHRRAWADILKGQRFLIFIDDGGGYLLACYAAKKAFHINGATGDGGYVADVKYGMRGKEETEANARLISKAPELLEALEELVAESGIYGRDKTKMIKQLIAEAKGETIE